MRIVTYGIGGYDPTKPNNNVVEVLEVPDDPEEIARQKARESAEEKLAELGITIDELKALLRY